MAIAGAVMLVLSIPQPSSAASRICRQLEAELASAGNKGSSAQFRKYDRAVNAQREQLSVARARARQAGCGFGLLSRQSCGPLDNQVERMKTNLAALERKRDQLGGTRTKRSRTTILAALNANDCRDKTAAQPKVARKDKEKKDNGNLFTQLFGGGVREKEVQEVRSGPVGVTRILSPNGSVTTLGGPVGQFSTMCVRACDGYFFPISPSSSSADFERDQKNCETTCPGTEVQLYYRPIGAEDAQTMMSVASGEPYASLPAAYLYRDITKPQPPACGCGGAAANPNFSVIGGDTVESDVPAEPLIPTPSLRPDPAADPETLANADGKLDIETIKRILKPKPAVAPVPPGGERKVRVVGPVFLPDQEGATDLQAPVPNQVQ